MYFLFKKIIIQGVATNIANDFRFFQMKNDIAKGKTFFTHKYNCIDLFPFVFLLCKLYDTHFCLRPICLGLAYAYVNIQKYKCWPHSWMIEQTYLQETAILIKYHTMFLRTLETFNILDCNPANLENHRNWKILKYCNKRKIRLIISCIHVQ